MGYARYYRPPTDREKTWYTIIISFLILLTLSILLVIFIKNSKPADFLSTIIIFILWLYSLLWFISSIKSKHLTKNELKSIFNLKVLLHPVTIIFGIPFGFLGGVIFAAIIEVLMGIQNYGFIFYFLLIIGFILVYSFFAIIVGNHY